jgi:MFS family permease
MACVSVLNVMDRQLLAVLIEPIKRELGVSDAAMGLLTGTSFALLHVGASIPIAVWADRGVRRSIIAIGLSLWSGLTVLTGYARSFGEIFAIRVGVGIGEASGGGPAQSLLADSFPAARRSTAMSVLVMGGPIGSMIAFALGGWLGETFGWRAAFVIFGAPGLLLALLIRFGVREPTRGATEASVETDSPRAEPLAPVPFREASRFIFGVPSIRRFVIAAALNTVGIYTILVWSVPYLSRVHALDASAAGTRLAIASGLFTALGTLAGGPLADRLSARDGRWHAWLPAISSGLVFPFGVAFALAPDADWASALLAPASFLAGVQFGPIYGAVHTIAAPQMRALSGAFITSLNTLLGLGLAPPLVGLMNDLGAQRVGPESIRYSLAFMMIFHLFAAGLLLRASSTLRRDLRARERYLGDSS